MFHHGSPDVNNISVKGLLRVTEYDHVTYKTPLYTIDMASFTVRELGKTDPSLTRNPGMHKYYLSSCQTKITNRTPTTEGWLDVLRLVKLDIRDIDKSRILLGALKDRGDIVIKIGGSDDIRKEYDMSERLKHIKGYVKYICFFECNDDFRNHPSPNRATLCKGVGNQMKVILMPYFPLGSIAAFSWREYPISLFQSCLKHAILSMLTAFFSLGVIHGDFHIGNVLLKTTKQKSLTYSIPALDFQEEIPTHGIRTWIMDFENSKIVDMSVRHNMITTMTIMNDFYGDLSRFFITIQHNLRMVIDPRTIALITIYIGKLHVRGNMIKRDELRQILTLINDIQFMPQS